MPKHKVLLFSVCMLVTGETLLSSVCGFYLAEEPVHPSLSELLWQRTFMRDAFCCTQEMCHFTIRSMHPVHFCERLQKTSPPSAVDTQQIISEFFAWKTHFRVKAELTSFSKNSRQKPFGFQFWNLKIFCFVFLAESWDFAMRAFGVRCKRGRFDDSW